MTTVIAERVKRLRTEARLSGPALATAMNGRGIPWNRTTVAKLETGRRESITVQELLALAQVLDVPPVWLLADPEACTADPLTKDLAVDPWTTLLWLTGWQPVEGSGGGAWASAHKALRQLNALAGLLETYRTIRSALDAPMVVVPPPLEDDVVAEAGAFTVVGDPAEAKRTLEATEASLLRSIADRLGQFRALELSVPPMPPDVRKRAAELGIELPGQES